MKPAATTSHSLRQKEIINTYVTELDKHLSAILNGETDEMYEISDFARILHIHPTHLSNTVHEVLGISPCNIFEDKILAIAKDLILNTNEPIANIARRLTYDPSNFTKFFKNYEGVTPLKFREAQLQKI